MNSCWKMKRIGNYFSLFSIVLSLTIVHGIIENDTIVETILYTESVTPSPSTIVETILYTESFTPSPSTTPSKCARLPAITLNCSLANLRGTANWTGSEFEVVHVEAICHQGEATEDKRFIATVYNEGEQVKPFRFKVNNAAIIKFIASTKPNMCTAAWWHRSIDERDDSHPPIITEIGPCYTSCCLDPPCVRSTIVETIFNTESVTPSPSTAIIQPTSSGTVHTPEPETDKIILAVSISVPTALVLLGLLIIITSVLSVLAWRKSLCCRRNRRRTLTEKDFELEPTKMEDMFFMDDYQYDQDTVLDNLSERSIRYQIDDSSHKEDVLNIMDPHPVERGIPEGESSTYDYQPLGNFTVDHTANMQEAHVLANAMNTLPYVEAIFDISSKQGSDTSSVNVELIQKEIIKQRNQVISVNPVPTDTKVRDYIFWT